MPPIRWWSFRLPSSPAIEANVDDTTIWLRMKEYTNQSTRLVGGHIISRYVTTFFYTRRNLANGMSGFPSFQTEMEVEQCECKLSVRGCTRRIQLNGIQLQVYDEEHALRYVAASAVAVRRLGDIHYSRMKFMCFDCERKRKSIYPQTCSVSDTEERLWQRISHPKIEFNMRMATKTENQPRESRR